MYVHSLKLTNVKALKAFQQSFQRPDGSYAGWNVFVGGNCTGKSTVLKSLALALVGPDDGLQLAGRGAGWISLGEMEATAEVEVTFDTTADKFSPEGKNPNSPISFGVRWAADSQSPGTGVPQFGSARNPQTAKKTSEIRGPWNPNTAGWFVAGYGPKRRLTGASPDAMRDMRGEGRIGALVTLFREDAALSEAEEWLKKREFQALQTKNGARELLEYVKALLADDLMPLGFAVSRIEPEQVFLKSRQGIELPMRDLSDGCRTVYALVLDIVHQMAQDFGLDAVFTIDENGKPKVKSAGVVLIDEVETHIHPSWQLKIGFWLKEHFPNVQFFISTHSPLILRAADEGGVFVLPSEGDAHTVRRLTTEELDRVRLGRAEKVLLGTAFGLSSTRGKWADARIRRFRDLDAKRRSPVGLSATEQAEYTELHQQMELAYEN